MFLILVKLGDWTVIDPRVAGWLLDPDYPPSCFEDSLNSVNLEQKKVNINRVDFIRIRRCCMYAK